MTDRRRVILITGSTDGIGKHAALELARGGAQVIVHGRSRPKAEAAQADLRAKGADVEAISFDLGNLASVRKGAAELLERFAAIDVLVNNAGIYSINAVEDESLEQFRRVMETNYFGAVRCVKQVLPSMRKRSISS